MRTSEPLTLLLPLGEGRGPFAQRMGRVRALAIAGLVTACSPNTPADTNTLARAESAQGQAAADDGRILCARGDAPLTRSCTVEQVQGPDGLTLTVRQPDGGFHRLLVTRDGRGVIAADGAQPAKVTIVGASDIEVVVGTSRYRLPATVKGGNGGG